MPAEKAEFITSFKNPKIQTVRELLSSRKAREELSSCVIEGVRLSEEAMAAGVVPSMVIFTDELSNRGKTLLNAMHDDRTMSIKVPPELMQKISATEAGQGLLLVIPIQPMALAGKPDFFLILDQVKDPGNVGTILRTASAAGVQAVLLAPGCADAYSPKVLRAGMGAHFKLPVLSLDWIGITELFQQYGKQFAVILADAASGTSMWNVDLRQPTAIIIGGEADGASAEAKQAANKVINIPMPGSSESLNASIAAGILLYEVVRQRSQ